MDQFIEQKVLECLHIVAYKARTETVVAYAQAPNGLQLLAYPVETYGMIVSVGFEWDLPHLETVQQALKRRAEDMDRYGVWDPKALPDGSWYLVKYIPYINPHTEDPVLPEDDVKLALELLS